MSTRAQRRRDEAAKRRFKRKAGGSLITAFIPAGTPLDLRDRYGVIYSSALQSWQRSPNYRCFCCRQDGKPPGALLFATPAAKPSTASLSVCCFECFKRPLADIEADAARVLRGVIADGTFEPLPAHDTS